ncbi:MAG: DUF1854 domain-containing protein [Eubacteriales bacterium]
MENKNAPAGAGSVMDIGVMKPAEMEFYKNSRGFLGMRRSGEDCRRVKLSRMLPFAQPDKYICVADMDGHEIGIIRDVAELAEDQQALVREELDTRYYCPAVTAIRSIKERLGYFYFDAVFGDYKKTFAVKDISRSIKQISEKCIIITDVDGSRYLIPDIWAIDSKSRRNIEPYLY